MDKIKMQSGGMPLKLQDLELMQGRDEKIAFALINGLTNLSDAMCVVQGLTDTINGNSITFDDGYIFLNGELFFVQGGTFVYNENYYGNVEEDFSDVETRFFHDGNEKSCWQYRRYVVTYVQAGNLASMPRLIKLLNQNITVPEVIPGPCASNKYEAFRSGIKYVFFSPLINNEVYYISRIEAGTGSGSNKTYKVEINKAGALNVPGDRVGHYSATFTTAQTGLTMIPIVSVLPSNTPGGINGFIVIDWSKFTFGSTYTASLWKEGALIMINTPSSEATSGGGGTVITLTDGSEAIPSGVPIVLLNASSVEDYLFEPIENIKGRIKIKNISDYSASLTTQGEANVDGYGSILLGSKETIEVWAIENNLVVVSGTYTPNL